MDMDGSIEKISALLEMMKDNDVVELELQEGEFSVCLRKQGAFAPVAPAPAAHVAPAAPAAPVAAAPVAPAVTPAAADDPSLTPIKSPIVGTFYRSSSPEANPYVEQGSQVSKSTVVCIIEAMKIMNEIKAEIDGTIEKVLVESGEPVEYGQPLFLVRRNA